MRFLVDMCVDSRVAEWLRTQGHDAVHLRDQDLQRLANGEIFGKALAEDRMVVTFDLDFSEIAALSRDERTSVIVLRLRNARYEHLVDRLAAVLAEPAAVSERGVIISVEETRFRVRHLPAGSTGFPE